MLQIDPELLNNTRQSQYRSAFEHGYRTLRFEPALERQFELFHDEEHLLRVRLAGFLAIAMYALFVVIDFTTLPAYVSSRTIAIRLGLIIPTFIVSLYISYRSAWRQLLRHALLLACAITGLGTVAVIGVALAQGYQIRYEGILLVALFIYLIVGLQWRRALAVNLLTLLAFIVMEMRYQSESQARLYEIVFMVAANLVGAYGGYFLEYSTRTNFLVNTLLNELAECDGLTGLYNRRMLDAHLDRMWRQAIRDGNEQIAVAMVDIDFFKRYNDRYGHAQGDAALRAVADVINEQARRPLDLAARYGGEEFVVVWHNPIPGELAAMGERLTKAIASMGMKHDDSELGYLTISVGLAMMKPSSELRVADLLRLSDTALYQAKHAGRNRVVVLT